MLCASYYSIRAIRAPLECEYHANVGTVPASRIDASKEALFVVPSRTGSSTSPNLFSRTPQPAAVLNSLTPQRIENGGSHDPSQTHAHFRCCWSQSRGHRITEGRCTLLLLFTYFGLRSSGHLWLPTCRCGNEVEAISISMSRRALSMNLAVTKGRV